MTLNLVIDYLKALPNVNGTIISNIKAHVRVVPNKYIINVKKLFNLTLVYELNVFNDLFISILIANYLIKNKVKFSNTFNLSDRYWRCY